jgi:hypothetical protein
VALAAGWMACQGVVLGRLLLIKKSPASPSAMPWQSSFSSFGRERRLVPEVGVEPTRDYSQGILSPQRLPFRHSGSRYQHDSRKRVGDFEFQISDFGFSPSHPGTNEIDSAQVMSQVLLFISTDCIILIILL